MPTVLDWLLKKYPTAKRMTLKRMVEEGRVRINGRAARKLKEEIEYGDEVKLVDRQEEPPAKSKRLPFRIVFEDEDILVIDKPAGLLTSTVEREKRTTALALVKEYLEGQTPLSYPLPRGGEGRAVAKVGLIHRLDKDASGLLIVSKNPGAYHSLKEQFFRHTVNRVYAAVVRGKPNPPQGTIRGRLVEHADGTVHKTENPGAGQLAISDYTMVRTCGDLCLLRVNLQTGRKHQIRAHLSQRGWPIVGDAMYGGKKEKGSLMLAAIELGIKHPRTGEAMEFKIPLPAEMKRMVEEKY